MKIIFRSTSDWPDAVARSTSRFRRLCGRIGLGPEQFFRLKSTDSDPSRMHRRPPDMTAFLISSRFKTFNSIGFFFYRISNLLMYQISFVKTNRVCFQFCCWVERGSTSWITTARKLLESQLVEIGYFPIEIWPNLT